MRTRNQFYDYFKGRIPNVRDFNRETDRLSDEEKNKRLYPLFALSLSVWDTLSHRQQEFMRRVVEHDRQRWVDYSVEHTLMGSLRYKLRFPNEMLWLIKILEYENRNGRVSLNHLAMCLLLVFYYAYRLSSLGDYIRQKTITFDRAVQFLGWVRIGEFEDC